MWKQEGSGTGRGHGWVATLASADSRASSEAGMTLLSFPYLCERTVSLHPWVPQLLMQAAPGRGMTLDKVPFLSWGSWELSAYSLPWGMKLWVLKRKSGWHSMAFMTDT